MQYIKTLIFGVRRKPVEQIATGFHSLPLENQPTFEEWCKEFNVSMLYDRKTIHI